MMLRTVGNYAQAKHKIDNALILEPENRTALFEMELLQAMIAMDE